MGYPAGSLSSSAFLGMLPLAGRHPGAGVAMPGQSYLTPVALTPVGFPLARRLSLATAVSYTPQTDPRTFSDIRKRWGYTSTEAPAWQLSLNLRRRRHRVDGLDTRVPRAPTPVASCRRVHSEPRA